MEEMKIIYADHHRAAVILRDLLSERSVMKAEQMISLSTAMFSRHGSVRIVSEAAEAGKKARVCYTGAGWHVDVVDR